MSEKERNLLLDVLRGVAILFVVLGHAIQSANDMNPGLPLQKIIMTFWMPLFFIISGFADGMSHGGRGIMYKANRLLVPYVFWATVVYFIDVMTMNAPCTVGCYVYSITYSNFWFLRILFGVWLVAYVGRLAYRSMPSVCNEAMRIILTAASIVVCAYGVSLLAGFAAVKKYVVVYLFGLGVFAIYTRLKVFWRITAVAVSTLIFAVQSCLFLHVNDVLFGRMLDLGMAFTGSGMACAIACLIVQRKDSALCRFMAYCGRTSLEIYAVHWCLLFHTNILCLNGFARKGGINVYCVAFVGAMAWMAISILLVKLLRVLPGGRIVFSGFTLRNASCALTRKG